MRKRSDLDLRLPIDHIRRLSNDIQWVLPAFLVRESFLPGRVGGYRTFRHVRVVGKSQKR